MSDADPYKMSPAFEAQVVRLMATNRRFFNSIRRGIDADGFTDPDAKVIVKACFSVFEETGEGPGAEEIVVQQLHHLCHEIGKITIDSALSALDYLEDAGEAPSLDPDQVMKVLLPQIRERMKMDALKDGLMGSDVLEMRRKLEVVDQIGYVESDLGGRLGVNVFDSMKAMTMLDRMSSGVLELDNVLMGGFPRQQFFCYLGGSNAGKSTALGQTAAAAVRSRGLVIVATNELPKEMWKAKVMGDLTDVPFQQIMSGRSNIARRRYEERSGDWGTLYVKDIPSGLTTPADLDDWRKEVEDKEGRAVDMLLVDYADRMTDGKKTASDYSMFAGIYNGLADMAKAHNMVVGTASQSKYNDGKKSAYLTLDHFADSRHKGRIANIVVSLNWIEDKDAEDEKSYWLYIAKQKLGKSDVPVGPITPDFEFGRISTLPKRVRDGASIEDHLAALDAESEVKGLMNRFSTE